MEIMLKYWWLSCQYALMSECSFFKSIYGSLLLYIVLVSAGAIVLFESFGFYRSCGSSFGRVRVFWRIRVQKFGALSLPFRPVLPFRLPVRNCFFFACLFHLSLSFFLCQWCWLFGGTGGEDEAAQLVLCVDHRGLCPGPDRLLQEHRHALETCYAHLSGTCHFVKLSLKEQS